MDAPSLRRVLLARVFLAVLLLGVLGSLATRTQVTLDVARLLPEQGALSEAVSSARQFGLADTLLIEVDGTGVERAALIDAVDNLGARLEAREDLQSVRYRVEASDGAALDQLRPWAVALVPAERLQARVSPAGIEAALQGWRDRMAGPAGGLFRRRFLADPLDLFGLATEELRRAGQPFHVRIEQGHLFDRSGQRAVLMVRPARPALSIGPDDPLVAGLEKELAATGLPTRWLGGHRVGANTATMLRDGIERAALVGVFLLGVVFLLAFRSLRPVVGVVGPLLLAVGGMLATAGLCSPIHALTLGFSSALLGLAVDYWIHLYVAASATRARGWRARMDAAAIALHELMPALAVSTASTAGAFLLLTSSSYPVVRDLGALGCSAAVGALVGIVLLGPLSYGLTGPSTTDAAGPARSSSPRWARGAVLLVVALAALLLPRSTLDGDPRQLLPQDPETAAVEAELSTRYGGFGTSGMVVVDMGEGGLQAALDEADRLLTALSEVPGLTVFGPGSMLPGPTTRARRWASLPPVDDLQARLDAAAEAVGFTPAALAGSAARIHERPDQPLEPALWQGTPLDASVRRFVSDDGVMLGVVLPDASAADAVEAAVSAASADARVVLPHRLSALGVEQMLREILRLGAVALVGVLALLGARYRDPRRVLAALAPPALAAVLAAGAPALLGIPWNAVSVAGMVLVLGLGLDYGVFMIEAEGRGHSARSSRAVRLSTVTTTAGFGPLVLSDVPALEGLGMAVLVGVFGAAVVARVLTLPIARGEPLLPPRIRRFALRASLVGLLGFNLDVLFQQVSWLIPPAPPEGVGPGPDRIEAAGPNERRLGPHRLVRTEGVVALRLEGSPYALGWGMGSLTGDMNHRLEARLHETFAEIVPAAPLRYVVSRGTGVLAPRLDRHFQPAHRLELSGAVDGRAATAGDDPFGHLAPAYTRKVYLHALHDLGQALVDSPFVAACTGFLAGPPATPDGHWRVGRNFDFEGDPLFDLEKVVAFVVPDEGIPFASVGFAGNIGVVTGLNQEGLAVALQAAGTDAPPRPGMPMTLIAREVLQHASSLDEAEAILRTHRGFVSENVLVVDGDAGEGAVFEIGPGDLARLPVPADGSLGVANHFRAPLWDDDETNQERQVTLTTVPRQRRMDALLKQHHGAIDMETAVAILRDRRGEHGEPLPVGHRHAIDADIATHSVVLDATARTIWVSRYPNAAGGYVSWDLDEALAGHLEATPVVPPHRVQRTLEIHRGRDLLREGKRGDAKDSERKARAALELMPGHPGPLGALAHALAEQGRLIEARRCARAALDAPPEYAQDAAALEDLLHRIADPPEPAP